MTTAALPMPGQTALQNAARTKPPIDPDILLAHCMRSVSFSLALLDELELHGRQQVEDIVLQASTGQSVAAADAAHCLLGAVAIMGAEPMRALAAAVEAAGRIGDTSTQVGLAHELRREMDRCLAYSAALRVEIQQR